MSEKNISESGAGAEPKYSWGAILFYATLFAVLVFFWWLLIESGGVSGGHG
jgi:hypothetical protein